AAGIVKAGNVTVNDSRPLTTAITGAITQLLQGLDSAGDQVLSLPALGGKLPVIDKSLNELLAQVSGGGLGSFLKWSAVAQSYFGSASTPTVAGLVQALLAQGQALVGSGATGQLTSGPLQIVGTLDPTNQVLSFNVQFAS